MPDWNEVRGYYEKLDAESPRVILEKLGKTAEGRDFCLATISSEANLQNLVALKRYNAILADPSDWRDHCVLRQARAVP